jgi:hypothetical protein
MFSEDCIYKIFAVNIENNQNFNYEEYYKKILDDNTLFYFI